MDSLPRKQNENTNTHTIKAHKFTQTPPTPVPVPLSMVQWFGVSIENHPMVANKSAQFN